MSNLLRRLAVVGAVLALLVLFGAELRDRLGLELEIEALRRFAESLGPLAPFLFVFVVAGRALLWLPSQVVLIAAGLCFGTVVGAVVGGTGLMLSGLALFALARYAGGEGVEKRVGRRGRALFELAALRRGAVVLALASAYPLIPLSPLQATAGLTAMPVSRFVLATFVGATGRAATYAFFGDAMIELETHQVAGALVAVAILVLLPLAHPEGRRWLRTFLADDAD